MNMVDPSKPQLARALKLRDGEPTNKNK